MDTVFDFEAQRLNGELEKLSQYQGRVLLIVNTASKCGFTGQYSELEALYQEFKEKGLVVLGFPCNQFGSQEPGTDESIQSFCQKNYGVTFPMFSKVDVNGDQAHPLFSYLKQHAKGVLGTQAIKWNFTKFLVNSDGMVVERFGPQAKPLSFRDKIQALLPVSEPA